jgi:hypothetical protein
VSILLVLLRLLTAPLPITPAAATETGTAAAVRPQAKSDPAALREARAQQATIDAAPAKIRTLLRGANDSQYRASCVAQRLAEAQVHVSLARDEMQRLTDPNGISNGDTQHALRRMSLIAKRTQEVEQAARLCVEDELSTISATKFDTAVSPPVERRGDPTGPPPPAYPCPAGNSCITIPWTP